MWNGQKRRNDLHEIKMSIEEFVDVCKRLRHILLRRLEKARIKSEKSRGINPKNAQRYLDAARELHSYDRLMHLCSALGNENMELRDIISSIESEHESRIL